jgi:hypothetical protein
MPYFDDDGNEIDMAAIAVPDLCKRCEKLDDPDEEILCNLNRLDQRGSDDFKCYAYVCMYGELEAVIIE